MATASLIIPSPNKTAFKTGNFYGFIRDIAATVSVAQSTALISMISVEVRTSKNQLLIRTKNVVRQRKLIIVPMIPKNATIAKF